MVSQRAQHGLHLTDHAPVIVLGLVRHDDAEVPVGLPEQAGERDCERRRAAVSGDEDIDLVCHDSTSTARRSGAVSVWSSCTAATTASGVTRRRQSW